MSERKIALLDLDAFYASCEELKDARLKDIPFAVGKAHTRGVITTCNYRARKFGIRSAMSVKKALELYADLKLVAIDMPFYKEMSQKVLHILLQYTDIVEVASIDEFYLDLSENTDFHGSATLTLQKIRADIRKLGITGSAGISNQKMVAKIASNERKPDGQFVVPPNKVMQYISKLELMDIPGIGPKTFAKLKQNGYVNVVDVQNGQRGEIINLLGYKLGDDLFQKCHGIDNREVKSDRARKSVAVEITLTSNITRVDDAIDYLNNQLWQSLLARLKKQDVKMAIKNQSIKIKTQKFKIFTLTKKSSTPNQDIYKKLFLEAWNKIEGEEVRLLGISVTLADNSEKKQLQINFDTNEF